LNRIYKVFVDFDGTITKIDVGEELFLQFGDPVKAREIIALWMEDKISSNETWIRLCETLTDFDLEKVNAFIDSVEIDDNFLEFVEYCKKHEIDITILSDGLDFYIDRILSNYKLQHLKRYSNKIEFSSDNTLTPVFPFSDEECKQCANCKRNHILNLSADDDFTIYIGDGYSDKCPAQFCDFIFAKNSLLKYCELNRITYFPYRNFHEVKTKIDEIRMKKRLKKKMRAELKRKEVYKQG